MADGVERRGTAAQISTYPMDVRHAEHLLPHQIRVWAPMVDSIVVTIDTHQSRSGRYRGTNFNESLEKLRRIIDDSARKCPQLRVTDVDYSEAVRRDVARYFFGVDAIPIKAWDGGPFYSYFFGLYTANAQYIMHFDGDMMFGGGTKTWMRDAIACMQARPEVLVTAPFPGPPRADGKIFGHLEDEFKSERENLACLAYRHSDVSTRAFMIDMNRFKSRLGVLPNPRPTPVQRFKARLLGNPPEAREAEVVLSQTLQTTGSYRIDLLGDPPGLWSLHPPYRSEEFYRDLPKLIHTVEEGDVPDGQRGHYDLNDTMIDWTQARAANIWHRRYLRMIRHRLSDVT
ncbi:MAG: capsular biosynthesis protein [Steroidobacteraceae bacterium]